MSRVRLVVALAAVLTIGTNCHYWDPTPPPPPPQSTLLPGPKPEPARASFLGLIGEYDAPVGERIVLEDSARLWFGDTSGARAPMRGLGESDFEMEPAGAMHILGLNATHVRFVRDASGHATAAIVDTTRLPRREIEPRPGTNQLRVTPVRPVESLRAEALAATPPKETLKFREPELVDLVKLDSTIRLEIRYATTNNFLGTRFYDQARAFMQKPAAEAVVRANKALRKVGYGLLIHDAYRPWYVTKMFWDATPLDKRWLVANPAQGSRHNRGAAVDLTLFDLKTGKPVDMPSTYDESTDRAYANYPGGTALQRWHRALLRRAMEAEGFSVNPTEWWHFDYKDWRSYAIGNVPFDKIK